MNYPKHDTKLAPKVTLYSIKQDEKAAAAAASADVPKTDISVKVAEPTPAVIPVADPAPVAAPVQDPAPVPAQDPTPAPVQAVPTPAEKASLAMVNEGGHSVVIDAPRPVREPSALMGTLPPLPAARGNGAAGPQVPAVEGKKAEVVAP